LHVFGENYASESFSFLQLTTISTLFMSLTLFSNSILRIKHKIRELILLNIVGSSVVFAASYLLINSKLTGIGWGWLIGQAIFSIFSVVLTIKSLKDKTSFTSL